MYAFSIHPYGKGALISLTDGNGHQGWGDISPLPRFSKETLTDALTQLEQLRDRIEKLRLEELRLLDLLPSVSFGLESALLNLLDPLPPFSVPVSALLMGSPAEILSQAAKRHAEGFTSAKLKVGNLSFSDARALIHSLQGQFRLRIDVNRAWETKASLDFFSEFPEDAFDYVEEPFKNPQDLPLFTHPLALDESDFQPLPTLKAIVYKPTIRGGALHLPQTNLPIVLSSSFESDLGLANIAAMAYRHGFTLPLGLGTYHYPTAQLLAAPLRFSGDKMVISSLQCV